MPDDATTPSASARRQILVVAGSGRSGTSLFTGLVGRLGVHIPKPEVKANRSNPRGFGEPRWAVDFHNDLLASVDVAVEDGRPEAWDLTGKVAEQPETVDQLTSWLDDQLGVSERIVVKDPRLAWFFELYRIAAARLDADLHVATMLRHPAEVMRSREIAYGTRSNNTTRTIGWLTMMIGIEARTRDLPRAVVRYDDLLTDWRSSLTQADAALGMGLFEAATADQIADAEALVDPGLRRSVTSWDELHLPARVLELATRAYDSYGRLVGAAPEDQATPRSELDEISVELVDYFDECFDVARTRTGATVRRERRKAVRRVREEHRQAELEDTGTSLRERVASRLRKSSVSAPRVAVLLAGGVGTRVGLDIPKQLIKIAGKTILEHTLAAFQAHPLVDEIIVMMAPGHLDAVHALVRTGRYDKVTQVLEGADTRNGTTLRALQALQARGEPAGDTDCPVLFHDAVRPLISDRIIAECFEALETHDAVDVAIPSADTIIEVDPDTNTIRAIPRRSDLRRGQTPQAFRASVLLRAYDVAAEDPGFTATDDCGVVLRYLPDVPIWVVEGEERNMKVTDPIDVFLADKLFQLTSSYQPDRHSPEQYRAALDGKVIVVLGGSYGIGADIASLAAEYGATVCTFSRSSTNTHVERRSDLVAVADQVLAEHGRIDHVVATAGILPRGSLIETSEETIFAATEVNYLAPVFIAQVFYPQLERTGGSLLLFTSSSYTRGRSGYSLYSSAKAAVVNLTQALADEWGESGVRVNCVNPERTGTPMRTKAFGDEPADSLLDSRSVARSSLDVLLSDGTGHVLDLRRLDPLAESVESVEDAGLA